MTSHLLKTSFLVLSLVACGSGTTESSSTSVGQSQTVATKTSLLTKVKPLQNWRADALVAAFAAIDPASLDVSLQTPPFSDEQLFATIDVSNPIADISATVVVPAGTKDAIKDPNSSKVFYVVHSDKADNAVGTFGPFELHSQEGGLCGGFSPNALTCAVNLHCEAHAAMLDEPGTCVAN